MIKFENTEVLGWKHAIRGMRNPMNSWDKSDSFCSYQCHECKDNQKCENYFSYKGNGRTYRSCESDFHYIGKNDLDLMERLKKAGTDHRKYLRMITVYVDITAPLYWWKEFDTYSVGVVKNSCSTMHKIHEKEFTLNDFSYEHLSEYSLHYLKQTIDILNFYRIDYNDPEKDGDKSNQKFYWWQMIQLLPSSYNQKRTVMLNYEVLNNIYKSRKNHKLDEWSIGFMNWIKTLPYANKLIIGDE